MELVYNNWFAWWLAHKEQLPSELYFNMLYFVISEFYGYREYCKYFTFTERCVI